jgi:hypothetical protein
VTAALIVSCADGRLRELLLALETRLDLTDADRLLVPGGPLALIEGQFGRRAMVDWLDLLVGSHDTGLVCLVSHEDCLAYADRLAKHAGGERRVLEGDLAEARRLIAGRYPTARVECFVVPRGHGGDATRLGTPERVAL